MRLLRYICLLLAVFAAFGAGDFAGTYTGEWKSDGSGNGGAIRFTLTPASGGPWKSDLTFGLDGGDVKTIMREVKVEDDKIELVYDFDVQGTTLRSHIKGQWNGTAFKGSYQTTTPTGSAAVDSGSWSAVRK
jgi:hypothetical protein